MDIARCRQGESVKIIDLARRMIELSGKSTSHPRIMKANKDFISWSDLEARLSSLEVALNVNDVSLIRTMMQQLVLGYTPSDAIVDWVYLAQEAEARARGLAG
jgi:FlaA1/EpsC-like NDP-sugar epimerase